MTAAADDDDQATKLVHLTYDGNFQLTTDATVLYCRTNADTTSTNIIPIELQLDLTTMHPQGGGQPTDVGTITTFPKDGSCCDEVHTANIDKVTIDRASGVVYHAGTMVVPSSSSSNIDPQTIFARNTPVKVSVDPNARRILSECHTAGHVVDAAMAQCEKMMPPTKGYHFMDGPYVEYKGCIDIGERDDFLDRLKVAYQELIEQDIPTTIETLPLNEAESLCNRLAQNFNMKDFTSPNDADPNDGRVRVVVLM
ncbi:predicted protein [Thalassiosira pseudonana CCMP1335]|uniref:Threonyl/alanyl tRNA synthetase SAD domain-containing protein n=1 Tax=Thalassiosira pseudonana TaxID=35128 RepID=B8CFA3_THAPS|nr:predicted protein [Thalassiosira pseudonana CCMP1335]EED87764.1 predicted protein [Thalassiosira pseudonana CCMP1335]